MSEFFVNTYDEEEDLPPIVLPIPYEEEDEEAILAEMRARKSKEVEVEEVEEPIILPIPYEDEEAEIARNKIKEAKVAKKVADTTSQTAVAFEQKAVEAEAVAAAKVKAAIEAAGGKAEVI